MLNILSIFTDVFGTGHSSSFVCFFKAALLTIANLFSLLFNLIASILWTLIKFVMGILEALEMVTRKFLGIGVDAEDMLQFAEENDFLMDLVDVFKAILIAGIVLLVIFTIFAIIRQEISNVNSGFAPNKKTGKPQNRVTPLMKSLLRHLLLMLLMPLTMIFLVQGVNSVLTAFNNAFTGAKGSTIAGQVVAASTYDANKYRTYANANQRVPIVIEVYDTDEYAADEQDKLIKKINQLEVQENLRNLATDLVDGTLASFNEALVYEAGKYYNSESYGTYYEKFVCTAEQYTAMADFVDYAQLYNVNFYIRSMDDTNIDWAYVSSTVYNSTDNSLTINYKDATGSYSAGDETYSMVIAPQQNITSPVSDALDSIMAMLGIGEYSDNVYNVMERDDSGEFLNLVDWQTEKCILKFSEHFDIDNSTTWTDVDQIIVYEYYHYPENNTLGAYSLNDFAHDGTGVEVPVYEIAYKTYNAAIDSYSSEKYLQVISLNGSYYKVQLSKSETDKYGNAYYELISLNKTGDSFGSAVGADKHYLNPNYNILEKTDSMVALKCSSGFNINKPETWTVLDQILIYEYYSDLTVKNDFGRYSFNKIAVDGVSMPVYNIHKSLIDINENNQITANNGYSAIPYVLINGTFYELQFDGTNYSVGTTSVSGSDLDKHYLVQSDSAIKIFHKYNIVESKLDIANGTYGFSDTLSKPSDFIITDAATISSYTSLETSDINYTKYASVMLQFSENFDASNSDTWCYRDYFLFYLYATQGISTSIDALKFVGLQGDIGTVGNASNKTYVFKTKMGGDTNLGIYLDLDKVLCISELNINNSIDYEATLEVNDFDDADSNLFYTFDALTDSLKILEIKSTKFDFSSGYNSDNIATWTLGDYVLRVLSEKGKIDTLDTLEDTGYSALTYEVENASGKKDILYAFGKEGSSEIAIASAAELNDSVTNAAETKFANVLYMSLNSILAQNNPNSLDKFKNLNEWLNSNLYGYLCGRMGLEPSQIVTDKESILNDIFLKYQDYILPYNKLITNIVENNWDGAYQAPTTFTYKNTAFVKDDPATWTNFDLLLFVLTGKNSGTFKTSVIADASGDRKYIKYADYAIDISSAGSPYKMTFSEELTITPETVAIQFADLDAAIENTENNWSLYGSDGAGLVGISSKTGVYTPASNIDFEDETTLVNIAGLRKIDLLLAYMSQDKKISTSDTFEYSLYNDGIFDYIKINDIYIRISDATDDNRVIACNYLTNMVTNDVATPSARPITTDTNHNAFAYGAGINSIKNIDAVIYSITENSEPRTYKIYKFNSNNYIYVMSSNGSASFVRFDADETSLDRTFDEAKARDLINHLYGSYYKNFSSSAVGQLSDTVTPVFTYTAAITANPTSWTPVNIILYYKGFLPLDGTTKSFNAEIRYSADESVRYLHIMDTNDAGITTYLWINITDISVYNTAMANPVTTSTEKLLPMYMKLVSILGADDVVDTSVLNDYKTAFKADVKNKWQVDNDSSADLDNGDYVRTDLTNIVQNYAATFSEENPSTWTWLDLLYFYYNSKPRTADNQTFYKYYAGLNSAGAESFVLEMENVGDKIYLTTDKTGDSLYSNGRFTADASVDINYSSTDTSTHSTLNLIVYKLTAKENNLVPVYKLPNAAPGDEGFYYVKNQTTQTYYAIYGLVGVEDNIGFSLSLNKNLVNAYRDGNAANGEFNASELALIDTVKYETTSDSFDEELYARAYYEIKDFENIENWSVTDFLFAYTAGAISVGSSQIVSSRIYTFADAQYFAIDNSYISLNKLSEKGLIDFAYDNGVTSTYMINVSAATETPIYNTVIFGEGIAADNNRNNVLTRYANLDNSERRGVVRLHTNLTNLPATYSAESLYNNVKLFAFSKNFDASNVRTWTLADYILYYMVTSGAYQPATGNTFDFVLPYTDAVGSIQLDYSKSYIYNNIQSFISNTGLPEQVAATFANGGYATDVKGGLPGYVYYLTKTNIYGNTYTSKVIQFSVNYNDIADIYIDYDVFMSLYTKMLVSVQYIQRADGDNGITESIKLTQDPLPAGVDASATAMMGALSGVDSVGVIYNGDYDFYYSVITADKVIDLEYKNYYYIDGVKPNMLKDNTLSEGVTNNVKQEILSGNSANYKSCGVLELKFSAGFDIDDPNSWTILDYIYLYEYSKAETNLNFGYDENDNLVINPYVASNIFYGLNFNNLVAGGNYIDVYTDAEPDAAVADINKFIAVNGVVYNLKNYIEPKDDLSVPFLEAVLAATQDYLAVDEASRGSFIDALKSGLSSFVASDANSFAYQFLNKVRTFSTAETDENKKVESYVNELCELCKTYKDNALALDPNVVGSDDYIMADYMFSMLNGYKTSVAAASYNSLAQHFSILIQDRIDYLNNNSKYAEIAGNTVNKVEEQVKFGNDANYTFKVLYEKINYSINNTLHITGNVGTQEDCMSYSKEITFASKYEAAVTGTDFDLSVARKVTFYRYVYQNTKEVYRVALDLFPIYEISQMILQVSWPQKIMQDMQVLYPDLNWSTLIATDGWLDTLGEFTSAYTNGMFVSTGNSSNTTAAGLVLSEFFLSVANRVDYAYADYQYSSLFDEDTIKALMLSLLGEEEYTTLKLQAQVFMEMFNVSFAPILENLAYEKAINIQDGQVDNFVMCVYKSYLATVLLSSDIGEYLYTVATRVYAQYTIYESLASAAGDYDGYYSYITNQVDANGEEIDAFTYGTFKELVNYENNLCGNAKPIFTFSMKNVYDKKHNNGVPSVTGYNPADFDANYLEYYSYVWNYYNDNYYTSKIPDTDPLYCYMFETYFEIKRYCGDDESKYPIYLTEYKNYLEGTTQRWDIVKDVSIINTTQYLPTYEKYTQQKNWYQTLSITNYMTLDGIAISVSTSGFDLDFWKGLKEMFSSFQLNTYQGYLKDSFVDQYDEYVEIVYPNLFKDYAKVFLCMLGSECKESNAILDFLGMSIPSYMEAWETLNDMKDKLDLIIAEINEIILLSDKYNSERTEMGSVRVAEDYVYENILDDLTKFRTNLSGYIDARTKLDQVAKTSINFALAEYGQNYVPTGYEFSFDGKSYTFTTDISAVRLAEYVFGGSYLEDFGIEAYYTDPDYEGIIQANKVYDSETNTVKTSLDVWKQTREFAGQLANYTGKLYYTSNFKDIAAGRYDGVKLDDYIFADVYQSNNEVFSKTTPEYLILKYLLQNEDINIDTLIGLIFGDTTETLSRSVLVPTTVKNLATYIEGNGTSLSDEQKTRALLDYLYYIQTEDYQDLRGTYYNPTGNTSQSERIHIAFKNVISYLLVSEEQEETLAENPIVLDDITMIEFKQLLMQKIVDYEQNPSETGKENANRYLALFNLISCEFRYYEATQVSMGLWSYDNYIGTQIAPYYIKGEDTSSAPDAMTYQMLVYDRPNTYVYATFKVDKSTRNLVMKLAGVENRPIEELVNLEYDNLYNRNGVYDENLGDAFVVCTMDEVSGKYIPVMARGSNVKLKAHDDANTLYSEYVQKYGLDIQTEAYDEHSRSTVRTAYPIIAKGVITSDGYPTAIRMEDEQIYFYRTNIIATADIDEDAIQATSTVSEITTIGYVRYVEGSAFKRAKRYENRNAMFSSGYDLANVVRSNGKVSLMQERVRYSFDYIDDYGGMNVLDAFSYFYMMSGPTYLLLLLGMSTMLPILFNATASAFRRILDLLLLTLISPVVIATKQIDGDGTKQGMGTRMFNTWLDMTSRSLLYAFGYIVAFNVYYIVVKSTIGLNFVSDVTFERIAAIGGLSFVTKSLLQGLMKAMWVIAAASFVKGAARLFTGIITNNENANPFVSALNPDGQEAMTSVVSGVKKTFKTSLKVARAPKDIVTGKAFVGMGAAAIEGAKRMLPGSELITSMIERGKVTRDKITASSMEDDLIQKGVDPKQAKVQSKAYVEEQREARMKKRDDRIKKANDFMQRYGVGKEFKFSRASTSHEVVNNFKGKSKKKKKK